jgi:hypothetical protein
MLNNLDLGKTAAEQSLGKPGSEPGDRHGHIEESPQTVEGSVIHL